MSYFYVIGTPIGNLEDITYRAVRVLGEVDIVLCEDTRVTRNLFQKYGISTQTLSYHAQSGEAKTELIIEMIEEGKNIALVSDAGTPGISDPGAMLVSEIRKKFLERISAGELKIEAIPGPSAITTALSIAGVPVADFTFLGFLPHKKGRETLFKEIAAAERTMAFYESPHRIMKTLEALVEHLGGIPDEGKTIKKVTVARELTKIFEEIVAGSPEEVLAYFTKNTDKVRGEFVVIVSEK